MKLLLLFLCFPLLASGVTLVPFGSDEGMVRLARSRHKTDFGKLANFYRNQNDRMSSGMVVGAIVLNALRYNTQKAPLVEIPKKFLDQMPVGKDGKKFDPRLRMYTPENFLNTKALKIKTLSQVYAEPIGGKAKPGIGLEQFREILEKAHGVDVMKVHVGTPNQPLAPEEYASVVSLLKKSLTEPNNYIIANYSREFLGQPGTGQVSPLAAYDEGSDSFLILDVNPFAGPWIWVTAQDLVGAMGTTDSDQNRGFLIVSER